MVKVRRWWREGGLGRVICGEVGGNGLSVGEEGGVGDVQWWEEELGFRWV